MRRTRRPTLFSRHVLLAVISFVVSAAMVASVASAASARAPGEDFTLTLTAADLGVNPAVLRDIVPQMQAEITEHGGLGRTLKQALTDGDAAVSAIDAQAWPDFGGTVAVTSDGAGLSVTIPAGEVNATATYWQGSPPR